MTTEQGASPKEQVLPPVEPVLPPTTPEVVKEESAEEKMAKLIEVKAAEAVAKALAAETEKSRRIIQSTKDKATAEVMSAQRRARLAETTLGATREHIKGLDPDMAKELELAELRAERQGRASLEQEEATRRQSTAFYDKFVSNLSNYITGLGIDPADSRIQVVGENLDYLEIQRQVLESVAKIQSEDKKASESSLDAKIKEAEARIKKELGVEDVNSVSTRMSGGMTSDGIPTDMVKFREWVASLPQAEYEKKAPKIKEMLEQGKIK